MDRSKSSGAMDSAKFDFVNDLNRSDLSQILHIPSFSRIQNSIAKTSNLAVITVDAMGAPISRHSRCTEFCSSVRSIPALGARCERCDAQGGIEAARLREPFIYICHMGLVDLAVPILIGNRYMGAVMAGQVKLDSVADRDKLRRLTYPDCEENALFQNSPYIDQFERVPSMQLFQISAAADMLFHISQYIAEIALDNLRLREALTDAESHVDAIVSRMSSGSASSAASPKISSTHANTSNPQLISDEAEKPKASSRHNSLFNYNRSNVNTLLFPALDYIHSHLASSLSLETVSAISSLSPGYFSKLFRKNMGCGFVEYVNHLRMQQAAKQLANTGLRISDIAFSTGFEDCGYFIKMFKREFGCVPSLFRSRIINEGGLHEVHKWTVAYP